MELDRHSYSSHEEIFLANIMNGKIEKARYYDLVAGKCSRRTNIGRNKDARHPNGTIGSIIFGNKIACMHATSAFATNISIEQDDNSSREQKFERDPGI